VFGRSGTVTAQTGDYTSDQVTEGSTNLYFTPARAQAAMAGLYQTPITTGTTAQYFRGDLSLATFPTTWAWSALTGIPTLTNTVFGRSGAVTAQAGDYTSDQVTEGISHLYFTNARAQGAMAGLYQTPITTGATAQYFRGDLSLATFPTTWAWANLTGVPTLTNTVFGRGGAVTAQSGDYLGIYEPVLGSPTTNGYVLTSTTLGVRSWVAVQAPITTGTTAQYFRGDLSLATFPTIWPWTGLSGVPTLTNTVFGRSGTVTAQSGDYSSDLVTEGTSNLYFTNARAQAAMAGIYQSPITTGTTSQYFRGDLSLATFPTTWPWSGLSGIPTLANTVFGRSGTVTAQSGDYTTSQVTESGNLYFTNARAQAAMAGLYQSPITTGTTAQYFRGDLSLATFPIMWAWANLTGVPTLANTVFGRSGAVVAQSGDYSGFYEPVLGNPSTSGYVLSSTTGGVRSWIAPVTLGGANTWTAAQTFNAGLYLSTSWAQFIANGSNNAFFGGGGNSNTGTYNTGFGQAAVQQVTTGYANTGFGAQALYSVITGSSNTAVGYGALYKNNSYDNTAVGVAAGNYYTGTNWNTNSSESVFLGMSTNAYGANDTNEIVIGYGATGAGSNTAVTGNASLTDVYDGGAGGAANHHENGQFLTSRYSAAGTAIPACNSSTLLEEVAVTDATSATAGSAYASGGTYTVPVRCIFNSTGSVYTWVIE
jgi:hypothetical protein